MEAILRLLRSVLKALCYDLPMSIIHSLRGYKKEESYTILEEPSLLPLDSTDEVSSSKESPVYIPFADAIKLRRSQLKPTPKGENNVDDSKKQRAAIMAGVNRYSCGYQ